jgi:hypothetical protein
MSNKEKIKEFLTALSKEDYVSANKIFPSVVKSSIQSLVNKKKEEVIEKINAQIKDDIVTSAVSTKE